MSKTPKPIDQDAQALSGLVNALVAGMGHGGLTYFANQLGLSPSTLKKRLATNAAFDAPTMRAVILIQQLRVSEEPTSYEEVHGDYLIGRRAEAGGVLRPTWQLAN